MGKGLDRNAAGDGEEETPEVLYSHDLVYGRCHGQVDAWQQCLGAKNFFVWPIM